MNRLISVIAILALSGCATPYAGSTRVLIIDEGEVNSLECRLVGQFSGSRVARSDRDRVDAAYGAYLDALTRAEAAGARAAVRGPDQVVGRTHSTTVQGYRCAR